VRQTDAVPGVYYHDYLQLDRLLSSQDLASSRTGGPAAHDEMLFIVIHQTYELWFKQIIWELDDVLACFAGDELSEVDIARVIARLARIVEIQDVLIGQIDVLETMTPLDFLEFRDLLVPASGFQSMQFRLIENKLGVRPDDRVTFGGARYTERLEGEQRQRVLASEGEISLHEHVAAWLGRTPFLDEFDFWTAYQQAVHTMLEADRQIVRDNVHLTTDEKQAQLKAFEQTFHMYEGLVDADAYQRLVDTGVRRWARRAFQAALFISVYRDHPALHQPFRLLELLIDVDEGFTTWRYRHALMTQRMIGRRVGTGGSAGAAYLTRQAERGRAFPDLLALATFLVRRDVLPPLPSELAEQLTFRYQP
jgi:tryptophan 2,3-dioxygenase